jgi:hypothetical protein
MWQRRAKFATSFAADVAPQKADFMANSQVPWGLAALNGAVSQPEAVADLIKVAARSLSTK